MISAAAHRIAVAESLLARVVEDRPDADLVHAQWEDGELRAEVRPAGDGRFSIALLRQDGTAVARLRGRRSAFNPGKDC